MTDPVPPKNSAPFSAPVVKCVLTDIYPSHISLHTVYSYGFICIIIWFIAVPQLDHKLHKDCEISPPAIIVVQQEWVSESHSVVSNSLGPHTVHGILQTRILKVAFPFSRGSSQARDQTQVSYTADGFLTSWASSPA